MPDWKIALAQMDVRIADTQSNLARMLDSALAAARAGAHLIVFPECALSGYCFTSKEEAWPHSQPLPGPATEAFASIFDDHDLYAVFGLLERDDAGRLFNSLALVGPSGFIASYRKVHLPILGVDRFVTPGDRPFAVHDLGGLKVGLNICYDGSFPEASRALTLLGADLILLPTNWPTGAREFVLPLCQARAIENHVYYAACNRVGEERGFRFIGNSRVYNYNGAIISSADETDTMLFATVDPEKARQKQIVIAPGEYEVNRVGHRRPEMYGDLCK